MVLSFRLLSIRLQNGPGSGGYLSALRPPGLCRLATFLTLVLASIAQANPVDITGQSEFVLAHGATIDIQFNASSYAYNNPGVSPDPTGLNLQVYGLDLAGSHTNFIPGTVQSYYTDFLFAGSLISADGSVSAPLIDNNATSLGMSLGSLLVLPGTYWGSNGQQSVSVIGGSAHLDPSVAALIFGPDVANSTGLATIHLVNLGDTITIGIGGSSTLRVSVTEPGLTGAGNVSTSGVTRHVMADTAPTATPEPGNIILLSTGGALLLLWWFLRPKQQSHER